MGYAKIENGAITNIIVADADFAAEHGLVEFPAYVDNQAVGISWKYDGTNFTEPDPVPAPAPAPAPTKEQLMAQIAALSAQIQALE